MSQNIEPACPDCGGTEFTDHGQLGELRSATIAGVPRQVESGRMYRCQWCGLAFRCPSLPALSYTEAYEQLSIDYWSAHTYCDFWPSVENALFDAGHNPKSILDIGCYTGDFLAWIKERHPSLSVYGIEPAVQAAEVATSRSVDMLGSNITDLDKIDRRFDVIVLFDVFEHLPDIGNNLDQVLASLHDGGALVIYTGNFDAWVWRLVGPDYYYTSIPEHVVFSSPRWCKGFATRKGLDIVSLERRANKIGEFRVTAMQYLRSLLYRASKVFDRSGASFLNGLPVLRRVARWPSSPVPTTARDHLLVAFRKRT